MKAAPRGFTLIELVVVLGIVGVLAGVVVLDFVGADRERNLQTEAVRLASLVELARSQATMRNARMGLFVDHSEYAFATFDPETGDWVRPEEGPFRLRTAPEGVSFSAATQSLELPADPAPRGERRKLPDILIFASGEQTPFTVEIVPAWGSTPWRVHSDGIQRTAATRAGEDAA